MRERFAFIVSPLLGWYALAVQWLALLLMMALLVLYRGMKSSRFADLMQFDDVPLLRFVELNYSALYCSAAALGVVFVAANAMVCRELLDGGWLRSLRSLFGGTTEHRVAVTLVFSLAAAVACVLIASWHWPMWATSSPTIEPIGLFDWLSLLFVAIAGGLMPHVITWLDDEPDRPVGNQPVGRRSHAARLSAIYLLGCASVFVYALLEHLKFWDSDRNGGFEYAQFFVGEHEIEQANLVLYSTSVLLASLAALVGCAAYGVLWLVSRRDRREGRAFTLRDCGSLAVLLAAAWALALMMPWQVKIWGEIRSDNGWILPAVSAVFTIAGLVPLLFVTLSMMRRDFNALSHPESEVLGAEEEELTEVAADDLPLGAPFYPTRSEFALFAWLLFPIYPLLRLFRVVGNWLYLALLVMLTAAATLSLLWTVNMADERFNFDDWRGMIKAGLLPFQRVVLSLATAAIAYLLGMRLVQSLALVSGANSVLCTIAGRIGRTTVVLAGVACFGLASWPFWGWSRVNQNVFARTMEFSNQHEFEVLLLHWIFDCDRDGFAAVLHGADPDDFDARIHAGGIPAPGPEPAEVAVDQFEVIDPQRAKDFPNLIIFYLEGVTPGAISAYGQRHLAEGRIATPNIDRVAHDGIRFNQARCFYPSTWDAWFAVSSGRFLRIEGTNLDEARADDDRYARYNNLYQILGKAGVNRWCHADTSPYFQLLVPGAMRDNEDTAWKTEETFDSGVTAEEEERGVSRGDKRNQRMLEFLDDLKPGDKFFMCEHMSDTHFPWERTSLKRAKELGFKDGLVPYEADGLLPRTGKQNETYSYYFHTITRMDAQIGQILKKLDDLDLYDNTMIVVVSDHGCQFWEHEHLYYVSHLYEQSLQVPLIIKTPGLPGGLVSDAPVMQMDLMPTVMELAGMRQANPREEDPWICRSLAPLMRGDESAETVAEYRRRDIPLTTHHDMLGVISEFRHKLIFERPSGTYLLFDLVDDPDEMRNLVDTRPELLEAMMVKLRALIAQNPSFIWRIKSPSEQ